MIYISQLLDATAGTVVALLGIWAALGRGHWFLRFLVVTPLLLALLLIPAYELVFHHSFGVMLIVAGIGLYQNWRPWQWRYTSSTILLLMVVAAVLGAVVVNAPPFGMDEWFGFLGLGLAIAFDTLVCLWMVYGKRHWWLRVRIAIYCFFLFAVGGHAIYAFNYTFSETGLKEWDWQDFFSVCYTSEWLIWWGENFVLTAALAASFLSSILVLWRSAYGRAAGESANEREMRSRILALRVVLFLSLVAVSALPAYTFYRLLSPTPFPSVELPVPNGYDDFVAAGERLPDRITSVAKVADSMPISQLKSEAMELASAVARVEKGLEKKCHVPRPYHVTEDAHISGQEAIFKVWNAIVVQLSYLRRSGDSSGHARACVGFLRFGHEASRGGGTNEIWSHWSEQIAVSHLRGLLGMLSTQEYRELAAELSRIDSRREPPSVISARQRLIDQHSSWRTHFEQLISGWKGEETEPFFTDYWQHHGIADTRLLIGELAIHAHLGDTGTLPQTLDELVPHYLPNIPRDPLGEGLLNYVTEDGKYKLYSYGFDRDDDGGDPENLSSSRGGDMVVTGPNNPALLERAIQFLKSAWTDLWKPSPLQATAPR